jgi:kumamolisin
MPEKAPLPGSDRDTIADATIIGDASPTKSIEVTVIVRPRPTDGAPFSAEEVGSLLPRERQPLTRQAFAAALGADPADLARVEAFAKASSLHAVQTDAARRTVVLRGTIAAFSAAFGVRLVQYQAKTGTFRGRVGPIMLPTDLLPVVQAVLGLDDRPQSRPHYRVRPPGLSAESVSYSPDQIAKLYNFPTESDGEGQCIAIIELGGGFRTRELHDYFAGLSLKTPKVTAISVDGAQNNPGTDRDTDGEVMLDIEIAGAVAPGATIAVYFTPNTDRGFLDAITTAIHDQRNKPSVISISWGGAEPTWTDQALQVFNQAFQDAAALGVTVCCASGDTGSSDSVNDGRDHVDFPASSPYVLACGGTQLNASGNKIAREVVWNNPFDGGASGGGVSDVFPAPDWQATVHLGSSDDGDGLRGRGVPDVAGNADPITGYEVLVDGEQLVIGGTSAVAPLWAGLIALINQHLNQPVGYLNPLLYQLAGAATLNDVTDGNNGGYRAGPGWDACTGFGSPDGQRLMDALSS